MRGTLPLIRNGFESLQQRCVMFSYCRICVIRANSVLVPEIHSTLERHGLQRLQILLLRWRAGILLTDSDNGGLLDEGDVFVAFLSFPWEQN